MKYAAIITLSYVLVPSYLIAMMDAKDGEAETIWKDYSIVIAKVLSVSDKGDSKYKMSIQPIATIVGTFDSTFTGNVDMTMFTGIESSTRTLPEPGKTYMLMVRMKSMKDGTTEYYIPSSIITFTPTHNAIVEVKDIDDPAIEEVKDSIRKARAAGERKREEARKRAGH